MRGKRAPLRKILPDPKYGSETIAKFINYVMRKGKKTLAQKIVYQSFEIVKEKTKEDPLEVFQRAIRNASPQVEVKSRRIGGANYQIPVPVNERRKFTLAARWLIEAAREKKGKSMIEKLAEEILAAAKNTGSAVEKKERLHKTAEANKAFAHLAKFVK
ncbi:MAG: 30S ribosomal protein S7 [Patescibacteria group bacterium]|nr:30S ribosomal protein S7 [Patescibacteria group bacterium]